jgi:hypothetical protein
LALKLWQTLLPLLVLPLFVKPWLQWSPLSVQPAVHYWWWREIGVRVRQCSMR